MNTNDYISHDAAFSTLAASFLSATSPTAAEREAEGALGALRCKLLGNSIDPHDVADRIRGCEIFAPRVEDLPTFAVMSTAAKRVGLDTVSLRLRLSDFLGDVRTRALSSLPRLSAAQAHTFQKLIDRAWSQGMRP